MTQNVKSVEYIRFLRKPFQIIRANFRAYLTINAIVYGLVITGMVAAIVFPNLGANQVATLEANGTGDLVRSLLKNPWLFSLTILGVNVTTGALSIVLPSLIVPFAGIALFAYKAFTLGLAMAPTTQIKAVALVPHSLTALIEFQAYALLMFGAPTVYRRRDLGGVIARLPGSSADPMVVVA